MLMGFNNLSVNKTHTLCLNINLLNFRRFGPKNPSSGM